MFDDANLGASAQHTLASARGQLKSLAQSLDQAGAHDILTVAGFVPGPIGAGADLANAALYFIEGDTKNALISLAATVIPVAASAALGGAAVRIGARRAASTADDVRVGRLPADRNAPVGGGRTDFFTVQDAVDTARMRAGGTTFPTGPTKAHFGPGV